ncbi:TerC family protein [Corallococcus exiguus]|uniref:TerC family protein n=1 Tax=Corallococcus TaxID=83461 RepID=UPI000EA1F05E|nr:MULTISPECIES: TerC family protein [Corallococcus]NNC21072.1 TerC family protein [Corallococcus exiguus]NRD58577.1 TerC family protein [Corallococcus exiguus]NRD65890.1 TerC family protein [Corallococcus exiguus]RKH16590.1 TerC family protein [Corallococcus sp. CA041A]RUO89532.1 TerC family protein [Corallococcus sp. AB018]
MTHTLWPWVAFNVFVLAMLAMDLGLFHRKEHAVSSKEATLWTLVWVSISLAFCGGVFHYGGKGPALEWLTAYVVEYALSVDNLFVFLMVFGYFRVPPQHQHRVLFWGILGAFVMRAVLIVAGTALVARFEWLIFLFGAFLVYTASKMLWAKDDDDVDPEAGFIVKMARRLLPVSRQGDGSRFFLHEDGRRKVTPLFIVLLVVEATDLLFAMDSIPAVLGISKDPFIIYTSNVCAILGLRSLFFVVSSLMEKFHLLKAALGVILAFVGVKMLIEHWFKIPIGISLAVIGGCLLVAIVASLVFPKPPEAAGSTPVADADKAPDAPAREQDRG